MTPNPLSDRARGSDPRSRRQRAVDSDIFGAFLIGMTVLLWIAAAILWATVLG